MFEMKVEWRGLMKYWCKAIQMQFWRLLDEFI